MTSGQPPREALLRVGAARLEARWWGPAPARAGTLVLLHEGLGSAAQWDGLAPALQRATGLAVLAYSRAGHGRSSPAAVPRPMDYVDREAIDVLPGVLEAAGIERAVLVGHSDGASIAAIHAGAHPDDGRVRGVSLLAPHFVVEDVTVAAIADLTQRYRAGGLRERLARRHADPDHTFFGWSDAWLDPRFRAWDIRPRLSRIRVPVQLLQGERDEYATLEQLAIARRCCPTLVEARVVPAAAHALHRDAPDTVVEAVAGFAGACLG